jgi:hypothetical protein
MPWPSFGTNAFLLELAPSRQARWRDGPIVRDRAIRVRVWFRQVQSGCSARPSRRDAEPRRESSRVGGVRSRPECEKSLLEIRTVYGASSNTNSSSKIERG